MKSTMEEASSILKAIEQGWERAGKPTSFSVKILEEPEKNFFGLTTKSAKIAFLFDEKTASTAKPTQAQQRPLQQQRTQQAPQEKQPQQQHEKSRREHPQQKQQATQPKQHEQKTRQTSAQESQKKQPIERFERTAEDNDTASQILWTADMVHEAERWIRETIMLLDLPAVPFTSDASRYYLKIKFNNSLVENADQERLLFSSFAHLLMQTLRQKYKKPLRGFKVVLNKA